MLKVYTLIIVVLCDFWKITFLKYDLCLISNLYTDDAFNLLSFFFWPDKYIETANNSLATPFRIKKKKKKVLIKNTNELSYIFLKQSFGVGSTYFRGTNDMHYVTAVQI